MLSRVEGACEREYLPRKNYWAPPNHLFKVPVRNHPGDRSATWIHRDCSRDKHKHDTLKPHQGEKIPASVDTWFSPNQSMMNGMLKFNASFLKERGWFCWALGGNNGLSHMATPTAYDDGVWVVVIRTDPPSFSLSLSFPNSSTCLSVAMTIQSRVYILRATKVYSLLFILYCSQF